VEAVAEGTVPGFGGQGAQGKVTDEIAANDGGVHREIGGA
jgi:hypothetical protein